MSSRYGLLCLCHDPAIELCSESERHELETALAAAAVPGGYGFKSHTKCDLMLVRYNDALVEIGCPGNVGRMRGPGCAHQKPVWGSVEWLRVLACAYRDDSGIPVPMLDAYARRERCWSRARVTRLAHLLEVSTAARAGCCACQSMANPR